MRSMRLRNCLGMIWSVSILEISRGAAVEVRVLKAMHYLDSLNCHARTSVRWPVMAAAAAITGETRCVRPPRP